MTLKKAIDLLKAEYEIAKKLGWVQNPRAVALHQVWKKAEGKWRDYK